MATIRIKRGLQAGIDNLVLAEGEMAVALDTGNVYIGTTAGNVHINPSGGTADEATKLKSSREFKIVGDGTSNAVSFNGTQDVSLTLALATMTGLTPGTYTKLTVDTKGRVTSATNIEVSDLPSNIPTSKISGLGSAAALDTGTTAGKVVVVGSDGKISESLLPDLAISDTFEASSQAEMLALNAQRGDICVRSDEGKSYILAASPATTLANWKWLKTPDCAVLSVNGKTGAVTLKYSDVGAEAALTGATEKSAPADNDAAIILDSESSNATKKLKWSSIKTALKTYFDTLYNKYTHPTFTAKASGLYKITVNSEGHVTAATAAEKADITALGIPAQDTTYSAATASTAGIVKVGDGLVMNSGTLSVGDVDGGTF